MMISIIIPTKNRPKQLADCLQSILNNNYPQFEILVLDQSVKYNRPKISIPQSKKITYIHTKTSGKSGAMNYGLARTKGQIIAFTDDDCVVGNNWLSEIANVFSKHHEIDGVFGKTLPFKPSKHPNQFCPSTITCNQQQIISEPCLHSKHLGYGNNMAFRKKLCKKNMFKPWLGPGSIGLAAEDADIALHVLIDGHKILYNPRTIVYHNKWLPLGELKKQNLSYICGEMACYGYYSLKGFSFARKVLKQNIIDSYYDVRRLFGDVLKRKSIHINDWIYLFKKIMMRIRGLNVAIFYYFRDLVFPTIY